MGNTLSPPGTVRALLLLHIVALLTAAPLAAAEPDEGDAGAAPAEAGPGATPGQAAAEVPPPEAAAEPPDEAAEAGQAGDAPDEPAAPEPDLDLDTEGLVPAAQKTEGVEEIVVTGVRLEGSLQAEPVSATTFGSEELKSLRIQKISDLADFTSNLEINTAFAASNPTLFIRGIGLKDYNANAASAVSVYQDGININAPAIQLFNLYDVDHVQVLKGPQGGGGGRNATAGAIVVNSALPTGEFDFGGSVTYGNYNNIQAEMAMSTPLLYDAFSARVAGVANFRDGTMKNTCANWDPEAQGFARVDQQTTEESFTALLPSDRAVMVLRQRQNPNLPPIPETQFVYLNTEEVARQTALGNVENFPVRRLNEEVTIPDPENPGQFLTFPVGTVVGLQAASFARNDVDGVCILGKPGDLVTFAGATQNTPVGFYFENSVPQLADFQGLKRNVNNVKDWAGRTIIRFQPQGGPFQALEGTDWLLNFHGGQNLSDSRRLQMLGANALLAGGFQETDETGFSEALVARFTGSRYEGLRRVRGLGGPVSDPTGPGLGGADPFVGYFNLDGLERLSAWGSSLRGQWDLGARGDAGSVLLTSLTGTEWYDRDVEDEGDANPARVFPARWKDTARQISQELRAQGEADRYGWQLGLFFLHEQLDAVNLFPDTRQFEIEQTFGQELLSLAPFLGGYLSLTDELRLTLGFRYNIEQKDFTLSSTAIGTGSGSEVQTIPPERNKQTWSAPTGDVTLTWMPTWPLLDRARSDDLNLYLKYVRGMKGGHFNASLTVLGANVIQGLGVVEPEFIHSIEGGWKSTWLDERLLFNLALFRYWYEDYQVFDIKNEIGAVPIQQLLNADARVWGAEVDLELRPLPGTYLGTSIGFIDSRFKDFEVTKAVGLGPRRQEEETFDYDGNPTVAAPRLNLSGVVEQEIPLWGYGTLVPSYSFSYSSKQYLDPQKLDPISQGPYWLHNARLAYRTEDEKIEVALWVENFLDERYKIDVFDLTREFDTILEVWGDPRTFGVTLSYRWK